jgi:hypothetical protein
MELKQNVIVKGSSGISANGAWRFVDNRGIGAHIEKLETVEDQVGIKFLATPKTNVAAALLESGRGRRCDAGSQRVIRFRQDRKSLGGGGEILGDGVFEGFGDMVDEDKVAVLRSWHERLGRVHDGMIKSNVEEEKGRRATCRE